MAENEKQFESNIEAFLISPAGGYEKASILDIPRLLVWRWIFIHWLGL